MASGEIQQKNRKIQKVRKKTYVPRGMTKEKKTYKERKKKWTCQGGRVKRSEARVVGKRGGKKKGSKEGRKITPREMEKNSNKKRKRNKNGYVKRGE